MIIRFDGNCLMRCNEMNNDDDDNDGQQKTTYIRTMRRMEEIKMKSWRDENRWEADFNPVESRLFPQSSQAR